MADVGRTYFEPLPEDEREIIRLRSQRLQEVGFKDDLLDLLATSSVELDQVFDLIRRGCPPLLVPSILF